MRIWAVKNAWLTVLLCWMVSSSAVAHSEWEDASAVVDSATQQMLTLLNDPTFKDESEHDRLIGELDQVLSPVVDFERIARGVMAKYFRRASADQKQRFVEVFKGTLLKTYAKALTAFEMTRYEIIPNSSVSEKPDKQIVRVDVFGTDDTRYSLVYFMVLTDSEWRLTNVMLDGINLRQIFRNQFADAVNGRQGDIGRVIEDWADLVDGSGDGVVSASAKAGG